MGYKKYMEITINEIKERFEELPSDLKWAIMSADVDKKVIDISRRQGLNVRQTGQLALETYMVMLGYTRPDKFKGSITASLGLSENKIEEIVLFINENILSEIKSKLMSLNLKPDTTVGGRGMEESTQNIPETRNEEKDTPKSEPAKKETIYPAFPQKLTATFKAPTLNTEHTLTNISKTDTKVDQTPTPQKVDPYRELPN